MSKISRTCLIGVGAGLVVVPIAQAQDNWFKRDRYQAVAERPQPEFDPEPVRLGAFSTRPELLLASEYNDNVLASPSDSQKDLQFRIVPRIDGSANWSRNDLNFSLAAEHFEYVDVSDDAHTDVRGTIDGRLDATRMISFFGGLSAADAYESRRGVTSNESIELIEYTSFGATAGAQWASYRTRLAARVGTTTLDYQDTRIRSGFVDAGTVVPQDFRDRTSNILSFRGDYAVTPDWALFASVEGNERNYDENSDRDSQGYTVNGGVTFELPSLIRGEIGAGYFQDDTDVTSMIEGVSVNSEIQWFPTQLTTATFTARRSATDPGLADEANAISTRYGARLDHELRRNIVVYGEAGFETFAYENSDRADDEFFNAGVGLFYKLNKHAHLEGYYRYYDRSSGDLLLDGGEVLSFDYDQNVIGVALRLFP